MASSWQKVSLNLEEGKGADLHGKSINALVK